MRKTSLQFVWLILLSGCTSLSACSTVSYLWQAGRGQLAIQNRARPIEEVIRDERTPQRISTLLGEVSKVKDFAVNSGLRPTKNYQSYVHLDRDAVSYIVSACRPLRFEPKEWKFPIVGGFPYLGFYSRLDANRYGQELASEGWEVDVRGAAAYSTLGWFRDPILSTMIPDGEEALGEMVDTLLHESVHASVYINGQAFFNESLASFVAEGLTPIYLEKTRGANSIEAAAYLSRLERQKRVQAVLHATYQDLDTLYRSDASEAAKQSRKQVILEQTRKSLNWPATRTLNNATLIGYREYNGNREVFSQVFEKCGKNWSEFLLAMARIRPKDFLVAQSKDLGFIASRALCN